MHTEHFKDCKNCASHAPYFKTFGFFQLLNRVLKALKKHYRLYKTVSNFNYLNSCKYCLNVKNFIVNKVFLNYQIHTEDINDCKTKSKLTINPVA